MDRLVLDLQNCYGIKALRHTLTFSPELSAYAIYAPNGVMKSSFAQVFEDFANDVPSVDRIFSSRPTVRKIEDESGAELPRNAVLVVRPYDEEFGHSEKTSTLLVNAALRKEYDQLHLDIDRAKEALLTALKKQARTKKDVEKEVSTAFTSSEDEFYKALVRIEKELADQKDAPLAEVEYDKIFDDKVLAFLQGKDVNAVITEYVARYNELLDASTYFKRGIFDYYNAGQIAKTLASNGFFDAKHTVRLNADTPVEITTQQELENVIAKEKDEILTDKKLRKRFDDLEKLITKNVTLRDFQQYVLGHETLVSHLANIGKFKEELWKSYLKAHIALYSDLLAKYHAAEARKREIEDEAGRQRTQWEQVIAIFNSRFIVPFTLSATNRTAVMLGHEPIIRLAFTYHDGTEHVDVERPALLRALSTGERKALYVLNVIFEVEVRKKAQLPTLMIVDDLADSFDYQNKYAIIQYLRDIADDPLFRMIIMTHNFDFFRTANLRFVQYKHCLTAAKDAAGITLQQASGIRNVFSKDWQCHFATDDRKKVACIPFLRNLIEYTKGDTVPEFATLTALLHWKPETAAITERELHEIYNRVCGAAVAAPAGARAVVDIIRGEGRACMIAAGPTSLENKVVLAIAIRLAAEEFMVKKINDAAFVASISANQTHALVNKFKRLFAQDAAGKVLDRVELMTPENIHLNSFMYEPIVDMSDDHLRKLYQDVLAL